MPFEKWATVGLPFPGNNFEKAQTFHLRLGLGKYILETLHLSLSEEIIFNDIKWCVCYQNGDEAQLVISEAWECGGHFRYQLYSVATYDSLMPSILNNGKLLQHDAYIRRKEITTVDVEASYDLLSLMNNELNKILYKNRWRGAAYHDFEACFFSLASVRLVGTASRVSNIVI